MFLTEAKDNPGPSFPIVPCSVSLDSGFFLTSPGSVDGPELVHGAPTMCLILCWPQGAMRSKLGTAPAFGAKIAGLGPGLTGGQEKLRRGGDLEMRLEAGE